MEIYVFRHGIAYDAKAGQSDADRRLTPEGKQKLCKILLRAREAGVHPDVILSSPYRRAVETAALARDVLRVHDEIVETSALEPLEPPEKAWAEIRLHPDAAQVMVVGHEPDRKSVV